MLSRKSLLIAVVLTFFISNISMAVMCARLKHVAAGENHSMALMDDNTLWACGSNGFYQLGLGSGVTENVLSLKQVLGEDGVGYLQNVATYDAGWFHSLAADANGTLWAWGYDNYGQLGNGSDPNNWDVPQKVHGVNDVNYLSDTVDIVYVSAGRSGHHSLAVDSNGYVYAWGNNEDGQCGNGKSGWGEQEDTPVLVHGENNVGYLENIIAADAGVSHSIALDDEGHVWHWGSGSDSGTYPEKVKASSTFGGQEISNITQISSCGHSVAVDSNGNVWEWSYSGVAYGGAYKVPGGEMGTTYLEDIVEVGAGNAGGGYSMARTSDGYVLVWSKGQFASPEYVENGEMETDSGLLEDIISIGAGYYDHKLAICENGYGWAWGTINSYGQFGVGDNESHPEPTQMLCAETSSSIYLTKTSEIQGSEPNCARPFIGMGLEDNYLVYDVNYGNPITDSNDPNYYGSVYDVNIVEHLPMEVDFNSVNGGGVYDGNTHIVTWTIGELAPGDSNSFTITTKVNKYARPGGEISNFVEMTADMYYSYATDTVSVCNWGNEIIYVDQDANGFNNGTWWNDAYTDLRDAFTGAENLGADVTAIWVAAGTYKPVYDMGDDTTYKNASFELLEDVGLFGHFGGVGTYETSTMQRNFADANNETILEGQIGDIASEAVERIVTAENIEDAVLDGFTIIHARTYYNSGSGIYLDGSNISVVNCKLKENDNYGIYAKNYSYPDVHNCIFIDNSYEGIKVESDGDMAVSNCIFDGNESTFNGMYINDYEITATNCIFTNHSYNGIEMYNGSYLTLNNCSLKNSTTGIKAYNYCTLTIDHSIVADNSTYGLYTYGNNCVLTLINSVVRDNGYHGLWLNGNSATIIKNNWIHNNGTEEDVFYGGAGICFNNQSSVPLVRNNTIYDNWTYGLQSSEQGADPNVINCIIYGNDSNDLYRENGDFENVNYCNLQNSHDGSGNITGDPGFKNVGTDPNDLHLDETSQCKDAGDPNGDYGDEADIDGESRIKYGRVDIGADEYYYSLADIDKDGKVNLVDYAIIAGAWQTEPNDNNYEEDCDLEDNNSIDYNDVALFCEDWLWEKGWDEGWMMCMGGGGMGFGFESISIESFKTAATSSRDDLMLSTAKESLKARPERLTTKSQKFYDITPDRTISGKQKLLELERILDEISTKIILKHFDEMWYRGEFKKDMTEDEYLEFRKAVEVSLWSRPFARRR